MPDTITTPPPSAAIGQFKPCWSRVGVWGGGDCAELSKFVHCRNCPTYSAAAAVMLDGAMPDGWIEAWTEHFAASKPPDDLDAQPLVIFRVNAEWLALPARSLAEVVERRRVHPLPHARSGFVKGIVNVRGQLLVCVSLTKLLQLPGRTDAQKASETIFERLLVVGPDNGRVTFPVSEVAGLSRHPVADFQTPPATVARAVVHFTRAVLPWETPPRAHQKASRETVKVAVLDEQRLFDVINGGLS